MLILLTICHTFRIVYLILTDFQNFLGLVAFFQDFPVLENAKIEFLDFPGFPGPRTLSLAFVSIEKIYQTPETVFYQLSKHLEFLSSRCLKHCFSCSIYHGSHFETGAFRER